MDETGSQEINFNLNPNAQRQLSKFVANQGEKPKSTVRFFHHDYYYTVHGEDDCLLLANMIYKSVNYVHYMLADDEKLKLAYVVLSKINFENALRELLLVCNYRAEVYERPSIDDNWQLEYRGSPGNLLQFENILYSNNDILTGNTVLSVQVSIENVVGSGVVRKLGVAAIEQNDCRFQLLEFLDNDFLSEFEACIVLLGPKECLLPSFDKEYENVKNLLERNNIMATMVKKTSVEVNDVYEDLNRLLLFEKGQQEDARALPELQLTLAREALRVGINYLSMTKDAANMSQYKLKIMDLKRFVHLDTAALQALNLLPRDTSRVSAPMNRWRSVLGVLDRCRTPQGHRLMAQWVKQPLRNLSIITDRHNIVQSLIEDNDTLDSLHGNLLKRMPDILMLTNKLMRKLATLKDLHRLYLGILCLPKILHTLQLMEDATVKSVICGPLQQLIEDVSGLRKLVEMTIDLESIENGDFLIRSSFDEHLDELRGEMNGQLLKMKQLRDSVAKDLGFAQCERVRLENVSHLGYVFRVVLKDEEPLRKNTKYTVVDTIRGGARFVSDKLKVLNELYKTAYDEFEDKQRVIVDEVINVAIKYAPALASLNNEVAQLDCLVSFALAARDAPTPYVRPKILDEGSGELVLKDLRHPCLELQENVSFIANDVSFHKDDCYMYIITGPNMGGKSTYIRSTAVAVLMALIGAFVPCSSATVSIVDSIMARIGANDNHANGMSTFMIEMTETSGILRKATDKSLVVIDELGRGTSTSDGLGIAYAIAEYLAKEVKCFSLFATHFHEVTTLADSVKAVRNFHTVALADDKNFTLLYQVRPGVSQRSFGVQVARLANIPADLTDMAERIFYEYEDRFLEKQTKDDKEVLCHIESALEELVQAEDVSEDEIKEFASRFLPQIEATKSEYFKLTEEYLKAD